MLEEATPKRPARGRLRGRCPTAFVHYATERIFMRHHEMWVLAIGQGSGLSGVIGSVGARVCRMLHLEFREYSFHALR